MRKEEPKSPLIFFLIGGVLVVLLKLYVFDSRTPFQDRIYDALNRGEASSSASIDQADNLAALLRRDRDEGGERYDLFDDINEGFLNVDIPLPGEEASYDVPYQSEENTPPSVDPDLPDAKLPQVNASAPSIPKIKLPEKKEYQPLSPAGTKVRVAVIIDDVGVSRKYSLDVIDMDRRLTLAFLPYADHVRDMTADALSKGHELMIHVPMEAMDKTLNLGPDGLRTGSSEADFKTTLNTVFEVFDGYVGINNHMGSRLTQDALRMSWVMEALKERDLFFVDSKTIHTSIAADVAQSYGVPFAERHVFLDHDESLDAVRGQLKLLEDVAYKRGYAIAIGHPKKNTLQAIAEWLPQMEDKGIELVPISALIRYPVGAEKIAKSVVELAPMLAPAPEQPAPDFTLDLLEFDINPF